MFENGVIVIVVKFNFICPSCPYWVKENLLTLMALFRLPSRDTNILSSCTINFIGNSVIYIYKSHPCHNHPSYKPYLVCRLYKKAVERWLQGKELWYWMA